MRNIERMRRRIGLTQMQVAKIIGVTQGSVSQWELGAAFPRAEKLQRIADLYGCAINELYDDAEGKTDDELGKAGE